MLIAARDDAGPLLGREAETKRLTALLDGIGRSGSALVLRGEPGIGKSRLLAETAALARDRDIVVLSTTGVQSEARLAFLGLHQLLRPLRTRAVDLIPAHRAALDAAFGLIDGPAPEHFRIAMAVLDLLSEAAADAPLLLLAEDAHWLDRPTSDVLAFVARRLESDPIVLLAASRDGYPGVLTDAGLPEQRLGALDPIAAAELLDASARQLATAQQLTTAQRDQILREAAGNPLALIELPIAAAHLGPGTPGPGLVQLTERLERAFAARASELPAATRLLLLVAALNDGERTSEILHAGSAVAGTALDLDQLVPAADASIVELDLQTVRFRHPLIRSAVRQSASVPECRRVHEALAETLATEPDRRVWHRAALVTGTHEDVALDLEEAGQRARRARSTAGGDQRVAPGGRARRRRAARSPPSPRGSARGRARPARTRRAAAG
jgi:hypothetical protein